MPPDALALYATVILLVPMLCFFLSAPTFLLVSLGVPEVSQLLRGLFNGYFLVICIAGVVATVLYGVAGRPLFALGAVGIAVFAVRVRQWLLRRFDAELRARDAGAATAVRQLRVVHVQAMLLNLAPLALAVASVPFVM